MLTEQKTIPLNIVIDDTDHGMTEKELCREEEKIYNALKVQIESDIITITHQQRVAAICKAIAETLRFSPQIVRIIELEGLCHDIGKLGVPSKILNKSAPLTKQDRKAIMAHVGYGHAILLSHDIPDYIYEAIFQHHEKLDGSGYPQGLKGDQICVEGRILMLADSVDAGVFRKDGGVREQDLSRVLGELDRGRNKLYDSVVVDAFVEAYSSGKISFRFD